jgi:hypothetical protein
MKLPYCNPIEVSLYGGVINKPKQKHLYFWDNEKRSIVFENPIIFGDIMVEVNTFDESNVSKVEFYIDDVKQFEDTYPPFDWFWNTIVFGKFSLKVMTYYNHGYVSSDTVDLWRFF